MKPNSFTSIDFETATSQRNSACAVGVVRYENNKIVFKKHYYIKPPGNKYNYRNIMVHGIYAKTTIESPTFNIVWEEIRPFIEKQIVIAHNASFDKSVLEKTLEFYDIEIPEITWLCTYELTGTNLEEACEIYDVTLGNHHNALEDALACGNIYLKLINGYSPKLKSVSKRKAQKIHMKIPKELHKPDLMKANKNSLFFNKHVVISGVFKNYTRIEIAEIIHQEGAFIQSGVNTKTDYVLAGDNMGPAKKEKAEKLGIPIISEDEFEKMIGLA